MFKCVLYNILIILLYHLILVLNIIPVCTIIKIESEEKLSRQFDLESN